MQRRSFRGSGCAKQLEDARDVWLVTTRTDGTARARPAWGLWDEDVMFLSITGGASRLGAIDGRHATVHLDSTSNVVILEGSLARLDAAERGGSAIGRRHLRDLIARWNAKYERTWTEDKHGLNTIFTPTVALAWRENEERTNADGSGKWVFD